MLKLTARQRYSPRRFDGSINRNNQTTLGVIIAGGIVLVLLAAVIPEFIPVTAPYATFDQVRGKAATTRKPRIASITESFTWGAYGANGFYTFYNKYKSITPIGGKVYTDLNLLSVTPYLYDAWGTAYVKNLNATNAYGFQIDIKDDVAVHNGIGQIFDSSGRNLYDALILWHSEYMTQQEYNNLYTFVVTNGGSLITMTGNAFYALVTYDPTANKATYRQGHGWTYDPSIGYAVYDGPAALTSSPSPNGYWVDANKTWLDSNWAADLIYVRPLTYNPFTTVTNTQNLENNAVTDPSQVTVLIDYLTSSAFGSVLAYKKTAGAGQILSTGVFGQLMLTDPQMQQLMNYLIYESW